MVILLTEVSDEKDSKSILCDSREGYSARERESRKLYYSPRATAILTSPSYISIQKFKVQALFSKLHDDPRPKPIYRAGRISEYTVPHGSYKSCTCRFSQEIREAKVSEDVKLSGISPDYTYDEFMETFNLPEKDFAEKYMKDVLNFVFLADKPKVLEGEERLSSEELQKRIQFNEQFKNLLLIRLNKQKVELADDFENADEEEREAIRRRDKEYDKERSKRLNLAPKDTSKKITASQEERMIKTFMALGMSESEAQQEMIARRSKRAEEKERKEPLTKDEKILKSLQDAGMSLDEARVYLIEKRRK